MTNVDMIRARHAKQRVREFWSDAPCGEVYARGRSTIERFEVQRRRRHELHPYLADFARCHEGPGRDVLEIGVGMGTDHVDCARSRPNSLTGIDLTLRACQITRQRLQTYGLSSNIQVADAEHLPFEDSSFDLVYSFGVLHHSPDTAQAVREVWRILRPGGRARIMIYYKYGLVGLMLWLRYGLFMGQPQRTLDEIYARHLESPGTKAYSLRAANELFCKFRHTSFRIQLCAADLLLGEVGQRHRGFILSLTKAVFPRLLVRRLLRKHGSHLLIEATR